MPDLTWNKRWGEQAKRFMAGEKYFAQYKIYGYQWGDPLRTSAAFVIPEYIEPFLNSDATVVEIGPGGGRYSVYLQHCRKLILVEYNPEFFPILEKVLADAPCDLEFVKSPGCSLPGIGDKTVDFVFSFDCFVHLDSDLISGYLREIKRVLKDNGVGVLHYADKTKPAAQAQGSNFSDMTPDRFRNLVHAAGFEIIKEDVKRISHSAIAAFMHSSRGNV